MEFIDELFRNTFENELKWCTDQSLNGWLEVTHYIKDDNRTTVSTKHSYLVNKNTKIPSICKYGEAEYSWDDFLSSNKTKSDFYPFIIPIDLIAGDTVQNYYFIDDLSENQDGTYLLNCSDSSSLVCKDDTAQVLVESLQKSYGAKYNLAQSIYIDRKVDCDLLKQVASLAETEWSALLHRGDAYMVRLSLSNVPITANQIICRIEATKIINL